MAQVTKDLPDWVFGYALLPRTALRPNQSPYYATTSFTLSPEGEATFWIEAGYAIDEPWVPSGRRFSIWYACFSIDQNSLIRTIIGVTDEEAWPVVTPLATKHGYGHTEYLSGILFDFEPGTRPIYYIKNYSDATVIVDFTVFGIEEVII